MAGLVLFSSEGTVSDMPSIPGTFNASLFQKHNVSYWLGCGTQDSFYDPNKAEYKALAAIAPQLATWSEWNAGHGDPVWSDGYNPAWTNNALGISIYKWAASFGTAAVVTPPPIIVPPPVVAKTIKSVVVNWSDGTSQTLP